ncbi:hypothetical protein [Antrihabitans stalactiti]|uniref:Uncharacterized protein n=1 Tax=Antrihabitans stalactiti TaxID=2584121 RepID=A0A848KQA5_9NOCA|nr:hypothetical protein [Antrihabitans stalactiti]NMN98460.1 hypothetical protein [Antrihabitans stalactiti]
MDISPIELNTFAERDMLTSYPDEDTKGCRTTANDHLDVLRLTPDNPHLIASAIELFLARERSAAERTLGRSLVDPEQFAFNCWKYGLGAALNAEQDRVDELDEAFRTR